MKHILLVEDDIALGQGIAMALQIPETEITVCRGLREARQALSGRTFILLILDINLPDGSGLTLLRERKALRPEQIRGWLGKVARNRALNRLRASREVLALEEDVLCLAEDGPQRLLEEREQAELVRRALGELERPDRELFVRHYYYGQTVARAAEEMGLNPSTAKTRLRRGREKLKEHLRKAGFCVEEAEDLKPDERVSGSGE